MKHNSIIHNDAHDMGMCLLLGGECNRGNTNKPETYRI